MAHNFQKGTLSRIKCSSNGLGLMIVLFLCGFGMFWVHSKYEPNIEFQTFRSCFDNLKHSVFGDVLLTSTPIGPCGFDLHGIHSAWPGLQRVCLRTLQRTQKRQGNDTGCCQWSKGFADGEMSLWIMKWILFCFHCYYQFIWVSYWTLECGNLHVLHLKRWVRSAGSIESVGSKNPWEVHSGHQGRRWEMSSIVIMRMWPLMTIMVIVSPVSVVIVIVVALLHSSFMLLPLSLVLLALLSSLLLLFVLLCFIELCCV